MKGAAILLAAGLSARMGRDKLRLPLGSSNCLDLSLMALRDAGIPVVVVANPAWEPPPEETDVRWVINPNPERGMGSSIAIGARALGPECQWAMICLADMPFVSFDTLLRLSALGESGDGNVAALSQCGEYLGPPALFGFAWFPALAELSGDRGAMSLLRGDLGSIRTIPLAPTEVADIDDQGDLLRARDVVKGR